MFKLLILAAYCIIIISVNMGICMFNDGMRKSERLFVGTFDLFQKA